MKIADLVKNKRKQLKETQYEFSKRFKLSHAAISDMESGKTKSISEDILNFVLDSSETDYEKKIKDYLGDITDRNDIMIFEEMYISRAKVELEIKLRLIFHELIILLTSQPYDNT